MSLEGHLADAAARKEAMMSATKEKAGTGTLTPPPTPVRTLLHLPSRTAYRARGFCCRVDYMKACQMSAKKKQLSEASAVEGGEKVSEPHFAPPASRPACVY